MSWWPKKKIVVPIDFSEESFAAIDQALQMVDEPTHVNLVHVLVDLPPNEPGIVWSVVDKETRIRHARKAFAERRSENHKALELQVLVGDPGEEIAEFAQDIGADLIVMPSHGRTGLKRILIGSVAERVIRLAHCPVLVLRK